MRRLYSVCRVVRAHPRVYERDHYVSKAQGEGYRSRSAFKLVELNERFKIISPGDVVVDLGSSPGGWAQVARKLCNSSGPWRRVHSMGGAPPSLSTQPPAPSLAVSASKKTSILGISSPLPASPPPIFGGGAAVAPLPPQATARASGAGRVYSVDIVEMAPLSGVTFICHDFLSAAGQAALGRALSDDAQTPSFLSAPGGGGGGGGGAVDVVLSDIAPSFIGLPSADQARQLASSWIALLAALTLRLRPGGASLLVKARYGEGYERLRGAFGVAFHTVREAKPPASRAESGESYLIGKRLKMPPRAALAAVLATHREELGGLLERQQMAAFTDQARAQ